MQETAQEPDGGEVSPSIIVGSRSGGVGKTTLAAILLAVGAGRRAVGFDRTTRSGASRLAQLWAPETVDDFAISPDIDNIGTDSKRLWIPFDVLGEYIAGGDCVIDLGANVLPYLAQWAGASCIGRDLDLGRSRPAPVLVVPTTASARALSDVREAFEMFEEARVPLSGRIVVFNQAYGPVEGVVGPDLEWIRDHEEKGLLTVARMPRCVGFGPRMIERGKVSFAQLPFLSPARFAQIAGLDDMRAAHSVLHYCYFVTATVDSLTHAGMEEGPSAAHWSHDSLIDALDRAQRYYAKTAAIRQTDILEKIRSAIGERSGVALDQVLGRLKTFDRTLLVEIFPELLMRLQGEFLDAGVDERPPDIVALARGFEGLKLAGERRRAGKVGRAKLNPRDLDAAIRLARRGAPVNDARVRRMRRVDEIRAAYGDFIGLFVVAGLRLAGRL